jgi:hypothetical protein
MCRKWLEKRKKRGQGELACFALCNTPQQQTCSSSAKSTYDLVLVFCVFLSCLVSCCPRYSTTYVRCLLSVHREVCHSLVLLSSRGISGGKDASEDGRCRNRFEIRYPCVSWPLDAQRISNRLLYLPSSRLCFAFLAEKKGVCGTGAQRGVSRHREVGIVFPSSLFQVFFLLLSLFPSFFLLGTRFGGGGGGTQPDVQIVRLCSALYCNFILLRAPSPPLLLLLFFYLFHFFL